MVLIAHLLFLYFLCRKIEFKFSVWLLSTVQNYEISSLMFFVGARKPLFSRIYNLRHDGLPSYDLMVVSVSGNFCEIESVWQKITLCEYLSQTPADEKLAQLSIYDQFFWVICLIHKMRWALVSKDFIHCCHAHLRCQNAYTRESIWIWSFHADGSGSGSDLHEKSWFSCCWFSYDPRSFRGQMFWDHKKWWTLWLSQPDT